MSKHLGYKVDFEANIDESKQELRFNFTGEEATKMFKQIGRSVHKMEFLINCIINRKDHLKSYLKTVFVHDEIVVEEKTDRPKMVVEEKNYHTVITKVVSARHTIRLLRN